MSSLFRKKSLDLILADAEEPEHQMKRALGPIELIALGIGAIVGAGIFAVIGTAAAGGGHHDGAGPALVISFVITAIACGFCALCYAEFASLVPIAGSAYTYSYATLGRVGRLDHRLGPDPRVRDGQRGGGGLVVRLLLRAPEGARHHDPGLADHRPRDGPEDAGVHGRRSPRLRRSHRLQPSGRHDHLAADLASGHRHQGVRRGSTP